VRDTVTPRVACPVFLCTKRYNAHTREKPAESAQIGATAGSRSPKRGRTTVQRLSSSYANSKQCLYGPALEERPAKGVTRHPRLLARGLKHARGAAVGFQRTP
jgi:hypothetical protein